MFGCLALIFSLLASTESTKRWHTSQQVLVKLYDLQNEHFAVFNDYLDAESERLEQLKKTLAAAYEWRGHSGHDKVTYLHNHINALQTINRINNQTSTIKRLATNKQSVEKVSSSIDADRDLSGDHLLLSFRGLRRLQKFYEIPASNMAAGRYRNRIIGDRMNAYECYVVSKFCFEEHDMYGATDWAVQAYQKWIDEGKPECVDAEMLNFLLTASSTATGFDFGVLSRSGTRSPSVVSSERVEKFARHYALMSGEISYASKRRIVDIFPCYLNVGSTPSKRTFNYLCTKQSELGWRKPDDRFVCRYQTKNSPYRLLMPFKEEDVHADLDIKIYHDVLYDDEIERIKTLSSASLADAEVITESGSGLLEERTRSGQVGRIFDDKAKGVLDALNARIECLTGWSTETAEAYQIVNYGLGGHYVPHNDAFLDEKVNRDFGNRLLTVLFYMSDVEHDGSTVFPNLNIVCPARKGTAVVWYNLHPNNGSLNKDGLHGSCPILKGNKWIMTRWLYEKGQNLPYDWSNSTAV